MANGLFGGGTGTMNNPFLVEDVDDLNIGVRNKLKDDKIYYFLQTSDIDLITLSNNTTENIDGFIPLDLGKSNYNGNGFAINNLYILNRMHCVNVFGYDEVSIGLFSYTNSENAADVIKGVRLVNAIIINENPLESKLTYVGGIVGSMYRYGRIIDCSVQGSVVNNKINYDHESITGGLVGQSDSNIIKCTFSGTVNGCGDTGGIVGRHNGGKIDKCIATCDIVMNPVDYEGITSKLYCGGIVGNGDKPVSRSLFRGKITGTNINNRSVIGGIAGIAQKINECASYPTIYNLGNENNITCGIVGEMYTVYGDNLVKDCYCIGEINAHQLSFINGIGGLNLDNVYSNCIINNSYTDRINALTFGDRTSFCFFNNSLIGNKNDDKHDQNGRSDIDLKDINTYIKEGYNVLYRGTQVEFIPDSSYGNDGDVYKHPDERIVGTDYNSNGLPYRVSATIHRTSTKINGVWETMRQVKSSNVDWTKNNNIITEGDLFLDEYNYILYIYNNGEYIELDYGNELRYKYYFMYLYDNKYRDITPYNKDIRTIIINGKLYRFLYATIGYIDNGFDFNNIWGIDSNRNNGYPYLLNINYGDESLGVIKVQVSNELVTIPLYKVSNDGNRLTVVTFKGLAEIKLVDVNNQKASPVRIMTANGIKSWSK